VEYRILGPLEVRDGGRSLSLGTAKQQALLAVLVLHANEFVPRERLIDELWGATPPPTAAKAIQVYVSHLRKLLAHNGDEPIGTRAGGYVLSLDGEGVDALSFERIAREAREKAAAGEAEQAASLFREALALWRGPALAGLSFESGARNEVERLEEERLAVLMDRIDCDLGLGRHEQLVGELEGLVAQHPLRERLRSQLMLALYRSGRQADALASTGKGGRRSSRSSGSSRRSRCSGWNARSSCTTLRSRRRPGSLGRGCPREQKYPQTAVAVCRAPSSPRPRSSWPRSPSPPSSCFEAGSQPRSCSSRTRSASSTRAQVE
jgi:DNA-binding SARP family transcriptional activator